MTNIINKLYYGEISPCSQPLPDTMRTKKNRESICSIEDQLIEQYPDCKELIESFKDSLRIESQIECEADFERGFKLGAAFMLGILNE